ncbi:uncharacterized protein Dvar_60550 [Desulfosarcina variabilis str. Montpellier]|uniref:hypothetical protein n=1 Tax=Desulfosarcina variabilis TaxID=2300 RepID=UPI003AFB2872
MENKANDTFAFDLENRLDDFFSDSLQAQNDASVEESETSKADQPLKELKSTILAIDWEITNDGLDSFIKQVNGLIEYFANDKAKQKLLKILYSLGKYLRTHKSKAHPDTIKRIMAVYSTLEESVTNDELSQSEKEKMLREEIKQFQLLKSKIVKTAAPSKSSHQPKERHTIDTVIKAIDELKSMIKTELDVIHKELKRIEK